MTKTLEYYNQCAKDYNELTLNIEFEHKREMLLKYLKPGAHILDLGCGSGRDSKAFLQKGYQVRAVDGSQELCKIASENIGQEVICQLFHELEETNTYDAVWACASLLHLPTDELKKVIQKVEQSLKKVATSMPHLNMESLKGNEMEDTLMILLKKHLTIY